MEAKINALCIRTGLIMKQVSTLLDSRNKYGTKIRITGLEFLTVYENVILAFLGLIFDIFYICSINYQKSFDIFQKFSNELIEGKQKQLLKVSLKYSTNGFI